MQNRRRSALLGVACLLTVAACGSGSDSTAQPIADDPPIATDGPLATDVALDDDVSEQASTPVEAIELGEARVEPAPANEQAVDQPTVTESPEAPAPAEPVIGGRFFAADVQPAAQFDANPFPDLVVDDIGKDTQVNIKNILPSDRPVLLWAWAPH